MPATPATKALRELLIEHQLPVQMAPVVEEHYRPLAAWISTQPRAGRTPLLVGLGGAQGTGKTTLARILELVLQLDHHWRVATLSLDDFYLTRRERTELARKQHSLLATRGVPGTHDLHLLDACLAGLRTLRRGQVLQLPRFDKSSDDRVATNRWRNVIGPLDAVLLEGWCIGSRPQPESHLAQPVNELEQERDPGGEWRYFVNEQLRGPYATLYAQLDCLIYLHAPNLEAVQRWRLEQEQKLRTRNGSGTGKGMNSAELAEFLLYFERITRADSDILPQQADVVVELDEQHHPSRLTFR